MSIDIQAKKSNILIVDDNTLNLQVLGSILRESNYKVSIATGGTKALQILEHTLPDLILLDVMMPDVDGFDVCKQLKSQSNTKNIPIIFLTAKTETEDVVKGFEVGGVDYITKPFKREELLARVQTHLELKSARELIEKQAEDLHNANVAKDRLFSIIGHDLRSPLGNIRSILELLETKRGQLQEDRLDRFIKLARESASSSFSLLENLLMWARQQRNELQQNVADLSLNACVNEVLMLMKPATQSKNITLEAFVDESIVVRADQNMLNTVIRNLLSNAIKFTPQGGKITINANIAKNITMAQISVTDTGVGISNEKIKHIFEKNTYTTTYGTNSEKGAGLGLKICIDFVQRLGGEMWVDSQEGKGSSFIFTVPVKIQ